jgi:WW domain-binding protein 4
LTLNIVCLGHLQSIEFHEKGKRHKENVTKRLSEIGKKSRSEHQKNVKIDEEMKKMEEVR